MRSLRLKTFKLKSKKFIRFYFQKVIMCFKKISRKLAESTVREKVIGLCVMALFAWSIYFSQFPQNFEKISLPNLSNLTADFMNGTSPNLWHPPEENANESSDRLLLQREWVRYISENVADYTLKPKSILVFSRSYSGLNQEGHPVSENLHCPAEHNLKNKCIFDEAACDTLRDIANYDAVVSKENCIEELEKSIWLNVSKVIPHIYVTIESPWSSFYPNVDLSVNNKIFVNYKRNSDIPIPYGKWIPFPGNNSQEKKPFRNYAKGRKTKAAIVLWGCNWNWKNNNSLRYVRELKKHFQIDIYGDCGKPGCTKDEPQKCLDMLKKKYKFYLAFENANCREYISDSFFRTALHNDIVPVVLGAHPEDYEKIAPKNSYIHVEQFKNPQELAKYLRILGKNDNLYNDYFAWKGTGEFVDTKSDLFCRLCGMLIYNDYIPQPKYHLHSWTKRPSACLPAHMWYWTRSNDGHRG